MSKILIAILAVVAFVGGGALVYNAAQEDVRRQNEIIYPDMEMPTGTMQVLPVNTTGKVPPPDLPTEEPDGTSTEPGQGQQLPGASGGASATLRPDRVVQVEWASEFTMQYPENVWYELPDGSAIFVEEMINEPCTEVCVWSGQAVYYRYMLPNGTSYRLPPFVTDHFPHELREVTTDYESFVTLQIMQNAGQGNNANTDSETDTP